MSLQVYIHFTHTHIHTPLKECTERVLLLASREGNQMAGENGKLTLLYI